MECIVDGCDNEAAKKSAHGLCHACYNGMRYWLRDKTPREIMARHRQLYKLTSRMEMITPNKKRGK